MKVRIVSYSVIGEAASPGTFQFEFSVEGGGYLPRSEFISVRTARVLVEELEDGTAFMEMLFAIAQADPSSYTSLVGRTFTQGAAGTTASQEDSRCSASNGV
jgi:hypothetical protein